MFFNAILVGALASIAAAQSAVLTFTNVPNPITAGNPTALVWSTNDTISPVTITLRQGLASNLQTVQVLTTTGHDNQYIWTPCASLPNGNLYALQIDQGTQTNYFGPFTIQGSTGSGTCSGVIASSTSSSASSSSTGLVGGAGNSTMTSMASSASPSSTGATNGTMSSSSATGSSSRSSGSSTTPAPTSSGSGAGFQSMSSTSRAAAATAYAGSSFAFLFGAAAAVAMA